jgi:class 3 adenylate cyclase
MLAHPLRRWLAIMAVSALAGIGYTALIRAERPTLGAVFGLMIGTPIIAYTRGLVFPALRDWIRARSTPVYLAGSLLVVVILIDLGTGCAGTILYLLGALRGPWADAAIPSGTELVYSLLVSAFILSAFRIRDVIGPGTFGNLLIGRYHRPVREERIFLFVDVVGSTGFAERHGDLRAQEYLGRFFARLARPVRRFGGVIDDYVGDMAIVSWQASSRGALEGAAPLRCVQAIGHEIADAAAEWRRDFGEVPGFRAALHCGPVVTAEIGLERHKITYFGDVMNTTARIETLCKTLGEPVLVSGDLMARLGPLPAEIEARPLGPQAVRGREEPLEVFAISRPQPLSAAPGQAG